MRICPKCQRSAKTSERIETDRKTKRSWLIMFCAACGYNYDIEEYTGKVVSPEEEMDRYPWPDRKPPYGFWPKI